MKKETGAETSAFLLTLKQVCERTSLSPSTIYRRMADGSFPKPVKIANTRRVAWRAADVTAWLLAQGEQTRAGRAA